MQKWGTEMVVQLATGKQDQARESPIVVVSKILICVVGFLRSRTYRASITVFYLSSLYLICNNTVVRDKIG